MEKLKFSRSAERKLDAGSRILSSFRVRGKDRDPKEDKFEELTWNQLRERSRMSKGALSKWARILWKEEYLKGEMRVVNDKFITLWSLARPELGTSYVVSERDQPGEEVPISWAKDPRKPRSIFFQCGVYRRSGKMGKGDQKIVPRKTRVLELTPPEDAESKPRATSKNPKRKLRS